MPPPYTEMARLNSEHEHQKLASQNMTDMLFILYFLETGTIYFLTGVKTWTKTNYKPLFYVDSSIYTTSHCNHNLIDKNISKTNIKHQTV